MKALGFDVKKADVLRVLKDYDREGTGKITFEDFNEVSKWSWNTVHKHARPKGESFLCLTNLL